MKPIALSLAGTTLFADPSGALWWPDERTLIVADLHFEKGAAFARRGALLPPYDTRATLAALGALIGRMAPARVVALGDSFHDRHGADHLCHDDAVHLRALVERQDWVWVAGNHDPAPGPALGGRAVADVLTLGPLTLRHEAVRHAAAGELSGHFHPKAGISIHGRRLTCRCFVADETRVILPAFGAYTGGLDVRDPAISDLFPTGFAAYLAGKTRLTMVPFPKARAEPQLLPFG
ncbi:MAG TPA: ligase-associated DNA damage response endonuclease PdeM [Aliidongia sp.]|uniref:ligase-associated DNA damage response endonuclease PdeM n=1 Tax=Aliidongia sp. TaxID=1914230 RepID=UPI002DDD03EF|nr:ligase-associated DNA damage response endonuclease PdeM [Aliidongia sp.]HEV2675460.1 ligase-associated DNA damage response endonuclease PdeM [Aliidongia sp.]